MQSSVGNALPGVGLHQLLCKFYRSVLLDHKPLGHTMVDHVDIT